MTDPEAEAALKALCKHYRQPVLPLSRFCEAVRTWFRAIERNNTDPSLGRPGRHTQGKDYFEQLRNIERDISKSNLLARLLHAGEKLRTVPCPEHKGHWTGDGKCQCEGTGWLREPEDQMKIGLPLQEGPWTSGDLTEAKEWWKWTRKDGAYTRCHVDGIELRGWVAYGPDGKLVGHTEGTGLNHTTMFANALRARQEIDQLYPFVEAA